MTFNIGNRVQHRVSGNAGTVCGQMLREEHVNGRKTVDVRQYLVNTDSGATIWIDEAELVHEPVPINRTGPRGRGKPIRKL